MVWWYSGYITISFEIVGRSNNTTKTPQHHHHTYAKTLIDRSQQKIYGVEVCRYYTTTKLSLQSIYSNIPNTIGMTIPKHIRILNYTNL